jgi:hypothetical protein
MGLKEFFTPTIGKGYFVAILVIAAMIPSSISQYPNLRFDIISQLQLILLLPWFVFDLPSLSVFGMIIWLVFVYVIACIYVYAFHLIDAMIREEFPHLNDRWMKRQKIQKTKGKKRKK